MPSAIGGQYSSCIGCWNQRNGRLGGLHGHQLSELFGHFAATQDSLSEKARTIASRASAVEGCPATTDWFTSPGSECARSCENSGSDSTAAVAEGDAAITGCGDDDAVAVFGGDATLVGFGGAASGGASFRSFSKSSGVSPVNEMPIPIPLCEVRTWPCK